MERKKGVLFITSFLIIVIIILAAATVLLKNPLSKARYEVKITTLYKTPKGMNMTLKNTGEVAVNVKNFNIGISTVDNKTVPYHLFQKRNPNMVKGKNNCFNRTKIVYPGGKYTCSLGLKMPDATERINIIIENEDKFLKDEYECRPITESSLSC